MSFQNKVIYLYDTIGEDLEEKPSMIIFVYSCGKDANLMICLWYDNLEQWLGGEQGDQNYCSGYFNLHMHLSTQILTGTPSS